MTGSSSSPVRRVLLCLVLATAGGVVADFAGLPLPYMLGAIAATMAAAMGGLPISRPSAELVGPMRVVLGVLLGSAVTPELFAKIGALAGTALFVPLYVGLASVLGMLYYRRVAGFSREEAFFSALPGGLYVMTTYAEESGVDVRRVALAHSLRVTIVVLSVPLIIGLIADVGTVTTSRASGWLAEIPPREMLLLAAAGIVGWLLSVRTGMPGGQIVFPMLVSALLHVTGLSVAKPPQELILAAQIVLGAFIGARYRDAALATFRAAVLHAVGHVSLMLTLSLLLALLLQWQLGLPVITGVLSFAPGGMSEIGLIALGLGLDVGFLATIHVTRVLMIAVLAPMIYDRVKSMLQNERA